MSWYRHRVERDLARWQTAGWVSEAGAAAIRTDLQSRKSPFGVAPIFAMLGAVLFGFAVMSFVAAHWTAMSKLARLALLLVDAVGLLRRRRRPVPAPARAFAQAAVLGGIAVYGASIMLIAQMYHMEGNPPDASSCGRWARCWPPCWCDRTRRWPRPSCCWSCGPAGSAGSATRALGFLSAWAAAAAAAAWLRLAPGPAPRRHQPGRLAGAARLLRASIITRTGSWSLVGARWRRSPLQPRARPSTGASPASAALFAYGLIVAFAGLYIMQFIDRARALRRRTTPPGPRSSCCSPS